MITLREVDVIFHTVCPCDLAPDCADLGAPDLLVAAVDESDPLAKIETISSVSEGVGGNSCGLWLT